jgi:hypothetical protein
MLALLIMAKSIVSMRLVHKIDLQLHVPNNNSRVVNQVISWNNAYMQGNLEILFYSCEKEGTSTHKYVDVM